MIKSTLAGISVFFMLAVSAGANDFSDALVARFPLGGLSIDRETVMFAKDFYLNYPQYVVNGVNTPPSNADILDIVSAYMDINILRDRRIREIKNMAMSLYNKYALYSDVQSVIDYGAALRAVSTTAATEMAALPDVASVKNYQPVWPAKPNL